MKKIIWIVLLSISLLFLCSCDKLKLPLINDTGDKTPPGKENVSDTQPKDSTNTPSDAKDTYTINDYYPYKENVKYEYEGKGNEYASFTVFVDYIKEGKLQLRKNNGGTELVNVLENKNGELKLIFSKEEAYYREDFTSKPSNKNEILLKEPLVKGTSWTLPDGSKRYISNVNVQVDTAMGNFKTLEVTTEGKSSKTIDYYALNTGLIKTVSISDSLEVSSTLKMLRNLSPLVQNVKFYYPNGGDSKLYFLNRKLEFKTNDITKQTFEKYFKESPKSTLGKLIGPNVKIKSLYLNGDTVYVDFTKELVTEMNAGSGYESLILQAITNTLGGYYNSDKVYITVEGSPYSSGHIAMKKGETFKVNTKNSIEIKN